VNQKLTKKVEYSSVFTVLAMLLAIFKTRTL